MGEPNAEDGLVAEVTEQFKSDHDGWLRDAKSLADKEATDAKLVDREEGVKQSIDACQMSEKKKAIYRKVKQDDVQDIDENIRRRPLALGKRKGSMTDLPQDPERQAKNRHND